MSFNLATALRESRVANPDKPLCHFADMTFSYAQVDEISGKAANGLLSLGLQRGDKVAVQLPNVPQFLFTYFGILKAGLTMVPLNPLLRAPEIAYQLDDSDAKLLVTFESFADEALEGARQVEGVATYVVTTPTGDGLPEGALPYDGLYSAEDTGDIVPPTRTTPPCCCTPRVPPAGRRAPNSPTSSST
ncbi:AMP-binding protein [Streptomyces antnestii]|uniref:AMP-binding protein n=1 Tax=Streptomyces antnestii TaxID=2494256 RepID=UPI0021D53166|nr:AMP-binding protein [Streptomyces sp. San01]